MKVKGIKANSNLILYYMFRPLPNDAIHTLKHTHTLRDHHSMHAQYII